VKAEPREMARLCDSLGPEDGIDPRHFFRSRSKKSFDRKTLQLCKQVRFALDLALAETVDPILASVGVTSVSPAPDASRLLVLIAAHPGTRIPDEREIMTALGHQRGRLRTEVGAAINRKRVPALDFRYQPPEEVLS